MPKLSSQLFEEFTKQLGLSDYDANILSEDKYEAAYYNDIIKNTYNYKAAANWMIGPVKSYLNEKSVNIQDFPIKASSIAEIISLIEEGKLNFASASQNLFPKLLENADAKILELAKELNIIQNSDASEIEDIVDKVLASFPEKVEEYKNGKKGLLGMFMGQVMKQSGGKADPKIATQLLNKKLN
ncbi:MAG: hypothetical protein R2777_00740 [Chitinophagales bacterium]